ncbi:MAG TPA: hypothetical protein VIE89_20915 [Candidatus Binatia bacterium]|jgi:hypothetical protein|nr:hypothetical protein [Candidatus Udaeobacter sp.]
MNVLKRHKIARQMAVSNVIGVIVSAVSLIVGFYLGHALQKPRLSIVDLDRSFYNEDYKLSDDLRKQLLEQGFLVYALRTELERAAMGKNEDPCTAWLDGEDWQDGCTEAVLSAARGLAVFLTAEPDMPIPEVLKSMRLSQVQRESFGAMLKALVAEMEKVRSDKTRLRTGDMDFDVGVLNTGDFDGVVTKFGKLTFPGGWFTIHSDQFTVVKAHGFETVQFTWRGWTTNEGAALDTWKAMVKKHEDSPFRIELQSGDGKTISYDGTLGR